MKNKKIILEKLAPFLSPLTIDKGAKLLDEGQIARKLFFVQKGCMRQFIRKEGVEITVQFFLEGDSVSSAESFRTASPSEFIIESIEPTNLLYITRTKLLETVKNSPELKHCIEDHIFDQFLHYQNLFLSRIMNSPQERYNNLMLNQPELIKRIPQKYLASYLGITPVSLSRIRNRR